MGYHAAAPSRRRRSFCCGYEAYPGRTLNARRHRNAPCDHGLVSAPTVLAVVSALVAGGCGRLQFDERPDAGPLDVDALELDAAPRTTRCGEVSSLVCDGFESGALDAWRSELGAGTLSIVTDDPYLGARALRASSAAGGFAYAAVDLAPISSGEVHARAYVRIPSGVPIDPSGVVQLLRIGRESDPGHVHVMVNELDTPLVWPEAGIVVATAPLARDRWLCLTLGVWLDATNGAFTLALDGVPVASASGITLVSRAAGFDELSIGLIAMGSGQPQLAIEVDEVSLSRTPLACD